ncbi:hypothetical protein AX16_010090 [Volvariella volvacea WC 439]|nr:hypothetical protein AX16_010090 [Volvariella volvacea WC 439]
MARRLQGDKDKRTEYQGAEFEHTPMLLASLLLAAFARSLASPVPATTIPGSSIPSPVCVVAAAITASKCDPTRTRTIFDILYSCIGVILLCTYISIHHNIPDQEDSWAKVTWSKLRTTLYALMAPEMVIMWAIRQRVMAAKIARDNKHRGWTTIHGFFVQMGGLVQRKDTEGEPKYKVICDPDKLTGMKIPCIPEKEIEDHGKGDLLAKAVVVVQTTWFVAQCIARHVEGLVLTEIELVTLAFATLNVITYALWWHKPLNIGYPIYFDEDGTRIDGPLAAIKQEGDEGPVKEWEGAWHERVWRGVRDHLTGWAEAFQATRRNMKESWSDSLRQQGAIGSIWEKMIVAPFLAVFIPLGDMGFEGGSKNRPTSVHSFYVAKMEENDHGLAIFYGSVIGIVFGGIHLIGWNFQFPTTTELWLWRSSSVVLTIIPLNLAISVALDFAYEATKYSVLKKMSDAYLLPTGFIGAPMYFAARAILLFLAFFTLRRLPDPAYENIRWTEFLPHF